MKDKVAEKNNIEDTDKNIEKNNIEDKAVGKNNIEDTGNVAAKNTTGEDKVFEKINIPKNLKMLIFIIPSIVIAGFSLRGIYVAIMILHITGKLRKIFQRIYLVETMILNRNQRIRRILIKQIQS